MQKELNLPEFASEDDEAESVGLGEEGATR